MSFRQVLTASCSLLGSLVLAQAAGSIDLGRTTFENNCLGCHGLPPSLSLGAGAAALNPSVLRNAIGKVRQMNFLSSLSNAEIEGIATYLGYPNFTDADCAFNWAEGFLPTVLKPRVLSNTANGYYFRYYAASNWYIATQNGRVLFLDGNNAAGGPKDIGSLSDYYNTAINADCQ